MDDYVLKLLEDNIFNECIFATLDRFARNRNDSRASKRIREENGVKVISVLEPISDNPEGIIMEGLAETMSEYYSANLSREVKKGFNVRALKCQNNGGRPPLGYMVDRETETFIINEDDYNIKIPISVNIEKKVGYLTMSISKSNQRIKSNDYEEFDLTTKYLLSKYTELDYEMCDYFSKTQNKSENKITEIEWRSSLLSKNMLSLIKQIENSNIKKKKKFLYDISQNRL